MDANQIPQHIKDAFAKKFPGVEPKEWETETAYEAEFEQNGKEVEVNIDADGNITQIEYEMEVENLPSMVKTAIQEEYPYCEAEDAERVEKADGSIVYEVSLKFQVHLTPEGKVAALGKDL